MAVRDAIFLEGEAVNPAATGCDRTGRLLARAECFVVLMETMVGDGLLPA